MDKRGDITLENALPFIIAVLGLVLLMFFIGRIFFEVTVDGSQNVTRTLDSLEGKIGALEDGEIGRFPIQGAEDWYLLGWSKTEEGRPDKCFFESCLCICPKNYENPSGSCQSKGFCRELGFEDVRVLDFLKIKNKEMLVNEFEIIRDIENPKYYVRAFWAKDSRYYLLDECPLFDGSLEEVLVYKKDDSLVMLKISEKQLFGGEARCTKNKDV